MKVRHPVAALMLAAAISPLQLAWAGGTHTVAVTATVTGTCVVNTGNSTLSFGALNPGSGDTVNATWSTGTFRCTNGTTYTVTSDDGLYETGPGGGSNRMKLTTAANCSTPTNCIRYTFSSVTGGTGSGMTTNISFNVAGTTNLADYQDAPEGSYADTVTLTVSP